MNINSRMMFGNSVSKTSLPLKKSNAFVTLKGKFNGTTASFNLDEDTLSKHTMLIGGTGCGKTTLFFHFVDQIRRKMTSDDVMIIFDSKGDFYHRFGTDKDLVLGNSKEFINRSVRWNIYKEVLADGIDEHSYILNIQEVCRSFFAKRVEKTTNSFFPNAASDLLGAIMTAIIRESINDHELRNKRFFNDSLKEAIDYLTPQMIIDNLSDHPDLNSVRSYIEGESDQSQGVLSEMYSVLREIFVGVFSGHGAFSIREFVRNKGKKTLFIEYDLSIGSVLTPVYSLLFDLALKEALGRSHPQGNVYLIADEFRLLPNLRHIDDGVNFGRSLGVKVLAGLQSIEQLTEVYGNSRGKNIAAGFSSVFAFHANDTTTRNFVTELFGKNLILEQYLSFDDKYREEKRNGHTVEDWDMTSLAIGEAIVGLPFNQPFRFKFDEYK